MSSELFLIIADNYDRLANMQTRPRRSDFDLDRLRSWLQFLGIHKYEVCWASDAKLESWQGPVLALGDVAHAQAVKLGKRVYKLPHPTKHSTTINDKDKMNNILWAVKREIARGPEKKKETKIKVVR